MVTPAARREAVAHLRVAYEVSERRPAILSRICCPTYMPSMTGNVAAVETKTSSQLNWWLAVRRIASKPAETMRYSDASFVNVFPLSPFASRNMKTSGPA
jgi:hypothetical protein